MNSAWAKPTIKKGPQITFHQKERECSRGFVSWGFKVCPCIYLNKYTLDSSSLSSQDLLLVSVSHHWKLLVKRIKPFKDCPLGIFKTLGDIFSPSSSLHRCNEKRKKPPLHVSGSVFFCSFRGTTRGNAVRSHHCCILVHVVQVAEGCGGLKLPRTAPSTGSPTSPSAQAVLSPPPRAVSGGDTNACTWHPMLALDVVPARLVPEAGWRTQSMTCDWVSSLEPSTDVTSSTISVKPPPPPRAITSSVWACELPGLALWPLRIRLVFRWAAALIPTADKVKP